MNPNIDSLRTLFINGHTLWHYPSRLFNALVIALLRIAAWDLGIKPEPPGFYFPDSQTKLPVHYISLPGWEIPDTCSPEFRALIHVLNSFFWKESLAHREQWGVNLPPEIFDMIFKKLSPRDILSLRHSSFATENWYYSSVPQFGDLKVRRSESSVPCCGSLNDLDTGVCCYSCYTWKHRKCIGLASLSSNKRYPCPDCHEGKNYSSLVPGGIAQTTGQRPQDPGISP